MTNMLKKH